MRTSHKRKCYLIFSILLLMPTLLLFSQTSKYSLVSLIYSASNYLPVVMKKKVLMNAADLRLTDTKYYILPLPKFSGQLNMGTSSLLEENDFGGGSTSFNSGNIRNKNKDAPATRNRTMLYMKHKLNFLCHTEKKVEINVSCGGYCVADCATRICD